MQEYNLQGKVVRSTDLAGFVTTTGCVRRPFRHARRIQKIANSAVIHYSLLPIHCSAPWRFSSEYAEDDTATVYYNYRHYEPVTGRWMRRDPLGGRVESKLYLYCSNRFCICDRLGLFKFEDFKGKVPDSEKNSKRGALVAWKYNIAYAISDYTMTYYDDVCKKAIKDDESDPCPCSECSMVEASFSDISLTFEFDPDNSWVKESSKDDEDLLIHENLHIIIGQKEIAKEIERIKGLNIAATSRLYCNLAKAVKEAEDKIIEKLMNEYDKSKKRIDGLEDKYDKETKHGTDSEKQNKWGDDYAQ